MAVRKSVPDIRFAGFGGDWERRKAADLAEFSKGNGYSKSDLATNGTPIILYGRLYTKYQFLIADVDTFAIVKNGSVFSQGGEVIVPASGETAEDIARASAVAKPGILLGGDLNILRPVERLNPVFLAISLSNGASREELARKAQGKSVVHIHNSDIQEISISFPTRAEQDRIVDGFMRLDDLIASLERKLAALANFKKAMLDKMFPKDGALVPEIRFSGFSGNWEMQKFSEITFASGEKNKDNFPYESYSITNENGFIPQDEKFENGGTMKNADKRMYYIVSPNSFAYNPARINVGSIGYQDLGRDVIVSSLYEVFKTTNAVDDRFLWHWFKSDNFQKLVVQLQEGGVRLYFYYDKLCMGKIALPSVEEQHRIGTYFDAIDNFIDLHQSKLDCLRNIKEACLEKMFV